MDIIAAYLGRLAAQDDWLGLKVSKHPMLFCIGQMNRVNSRNSDHGFAANILTDIELFDKAAWDLLYKIQLHEHSLNLILPEEKNPSLAHRPRTHRFQLPNCFLAF